MITKLRNFINESNNESNIVPDNIIDAFYDRIKKRIADHKDKNHPLVKKELDRIKSINGKIPEKIQELLNESVRDKMTPKSEEEINKSLSHLEPNDRLIKGSIEGVLGLVKGAIEDGANVNFNNNNMGHAWTPLFYASLNNHEEVVKYLLSKGAGVTIDTMKYTKQRGLYNIVNLLIPYEFKTNESVRDKMTPKSLEDINNIPTDEKFRLGCVYGYFDIVKQALKEGNITDKLLNQGFESAVYSNNIEIVYFLLRNGADVNSNNGTALNRACLFNHIEMVKLLIDLGADVNKINDKVKLNISQNRRTELMKLLDENGLHIEPIKTWGTTE